MTDVPPPPSDLRLLYDAERAAPVRAALGAEARVLAAVERRLGWEQAIPQPSVSTPSAALGKAWVGMVAAAGIAAGFALGVVVTNLSFESVEAPARLPPAPSADPAAFVAPQEEAPRVELERADPEPETSPAPPKREGRIARQATHEAALIDRARLALRRDRPHDALVAAMEHARRFPSGALTQERERLLVEALVRDGRPDRARDRAEAFFARFPGSPYETELRRMLAP